MRLGEVKVPCPFLVMFLGSNISIVSVGQAENERFPKMRKGIRTRDAVKPEQNIVESVEILPLPKGDGALPGSKEKGLSKQRRAGLGGIPAAGRGLCPPPGGLPLPGMQRWNWPAAGM